MHPQGLGFLPHPLYVACLTLIANPAQTLYARTPRQLRQVHDMPAYDTVILPDSPEGMKRASALLREGRQVAFPTETVYGLGADARDASAVAGIFAAKDRPAFNPLIVHVANADTAWRYVEWSRKAERLANLFWPGPLTMVLPLRSDCGIADLVTAGLPSLAVRVPAHPIAQKLLTHFNGPIAAPSANPSGRISATTADHCIAGLDGRIAAIVDGGSCPVGLESTIVGLEDDPVLLRPGGLANEDIAAALGRPLRTRDQADAVTAPGQLRSHYAPRAALRLNATARRKGEVLLGFGAMECDLNLSPRGDLTDAAARLFSALHELDASGQPIAVAPIPDRGLGLAINDRLRRAAAPRNG